MKLIFIGLHHPWNDPRLYYRQIHFLKQYYASITIFTIGSSKISTPPEKLENINTVLYEYLPSKIFIKFKLINRLYNKISQIIWKYKIAFKIKADFIQASDIREILFAFILKLLTGAKIIYDSHEDYFHSIYEFYGKKLKFLLIASKYELIEIIFLRFFNAVYCTDEYLYNKYSSSLYKCKKVNLLRNFPNTSLINNRCTYQNKNELNLVYIGGINKYRGVIECANFVDKFNKKYKGTYRLLFHVFSPKNEIITELVAKKLILHNNYIDYNILLNKLPEFDVGICLWQRLKKFERNLPLKNFDYMAVGLPLITSNFGNLKKYVEASKSGLCINPLDYEEFESAIILLLNNKKRKEFGENGIKFTTNRYSFEVEAKEYINFFGENYTTR